MNSHSSLWMTRCAHARMFRAILSSWLILVMSLGPAVAQAPPAPPGVNELPLRLKFQDMDIELILEEYSDKTGRTLLRAPGLKKTKITLQSQGELTLDEYLQAIEVVLSMHGVSLLKVGEKFLKVVPSNQAPQESIRIRDTIPGAEEMEDSGALVSQMIPLKHIELAEARKAIEPLRHATYAPIHALERVNSLLVTDTAANINRILQVLKHIDQPIEAREAMHIIQIRHAKAAEIKKKLEEIIKQIQDEQAKQQSTVPPTKMAGSPGVSAPPAPPGVLRARTVTPKPTPAVVEDILEQAERGIIEGKVKMVADDRTNILIMITRPENMPFFENMIKALDVETAPDVVVKIYRLEYATAEEVASTLNTLIGKAEKDVPPPPTGEATEGESSRVTALREYVEQLRNASTQRDEKSKVGELSASNIKILPDKRTNSLIIMARRSDVLTIEEIIKNMDMMLSQVLVEAVIIQVQLDDEISSGVHWVQRALLFQDEGAGGDTLTRAAIAGSAGPGAGDVTPGLQSAASLTSLGGWAASSGLTGYFTHFGLSLDAIVKLVSTDSRTQILSAPVIVTTDNTKARISASEQKYFLKGSTVDQFGNVRPETEIRDIGLDLEVTPHINQSGNVMMELVQEVSDPGADQTIEGQGSWPTTRTRSFTASIAVQDRETIVLGGLVRNYKQRTRRKVPLLGDIPLLGRLFRSDTDVDNRGEVVVFVTPYVLDTPDAIEQEARRRKEALSVKGLWKQGWSDSEMAELPDSGPARTSYIFREKEMSLRERAMDLEDRALSLREKELKLLEILRQQQMYMQQGVEIVEPETPKKNPPEKTPPGEVPPVPPEGEAPPAPPVEQAPPTSPEAPPTAVPTNDAAVDPRLIQLIQDDQARWDATLKRVDALMERDL